MILSLQLPIDIQDVKIRILYSRILLDQKATPAVTLLPKIAHRGHRSSWPLPKISQRADFFTVGPVRDLTGQQKERERERVRATRSFCSHSHSHTHIFLPGSCQVFDRFYDNKFKTKQW